jgi:ribonucleoside-diphosphate reductase alpha chain
MSFFTDPFAEEVYETKYAGRFSKNIDGMHKFLAATFCAGDAKMEERIYEALSSKKFCPGGRILAFAGRDDVGGLSLMNCTTHAVEGDTIESISKTMSTIMKASSRGQGIGVNISKLRPKDSPVANAAKTSTGALSFMELFNHVGGVIGQEGRRAALLFSMDVKHPDIYRPGAGDVECPKCRGGGCMECRFSGKVPYDFLRIKTLPGRVENANISVMVSDDFMYAVKNDQPWELTFDGESGGKSFHVKKTVRAIDLFTELAACAWRSAEPGVLFIDTQRDLSNSDAFGDRWKVVGTNACSEVVLDQDGVCNLGSINLGAFVVDPFTKDAYFDIEGFRDTVEMAVTFLDNVIEKEIQDHRAVTNTQMESDIALRRIGLGVMGYADMVAFLGERYEESEDLADEIFGTAKRTAYQTTIHLAKERGACGVWEGTDIHTRSQIVEEGFYKTLPDKLKREIILHGTRNITLLSIAPTGSISNLLGASSGIEPVFALEYKRRTRIHGEDTFVDYVHPGALLSRSMGIPDSVWQTSYEVSPSDHIKVQAAIQSHVDSAISKTVNLPKDASVQDIADLYMLAWELWLKGITVYRDGSRDEAVLYREGEGEVCPNCGGELIHHGGCKECKDCGTGLCNT